MKINRIIFGCNNNINYINFWIYLAQLWKKKDVIPTLFFIGKKEEFMFENIKGSEVYFIENIPDEIPSGIYARIIRCFVPLLFPNEVCFISDMDIFPINIDYFFESLHVLDNNQLACFASNFYIILQPWRKPFSYICGKSETFAEILGIKIIKKSYEEWINLFNECISIWFSLGFNIQTDEYIFSLLLQNWDSKRIKDFNWDMKYTPLGKILDCVPRLRKNNSLDLTELKKGKYIDFEPKKPFHLHYKEYIPIFKYIKLSLPKIYKFGKLLPEKKYPRNSLYYVIPEGLCKTIKNIKRNQELLSEGKNKIGFGIDVNCTFDEIYKTLKINSIYKKKHMERANYMCRHQIITNEEKELYLKEFTSRFGKLK